MSNQTDADIAPLAGRLAQAARARRPLRAAGAASAVADPVAAEAGLNHP